MLALRQSPPAGQPFSQGGDNGSKQYRLASSSRTGEEEIDSGGDREVVYSCLSNWTIAFRSNHTRRRERQYLEGHWGKYGVLGDALKQVYLSCVLLMM
jgi:hypothetical protein